MYDERTQKGIYSACNEEGSFLPIAKLDKDLIKIMLQVASLDFEVVKEWKKNSSKDGKQWNAIYKIHYDVLHKLCETLLLFDKMKARTHECLFTYLCEKHSELELSWNFFEKIRTKRNRSLYYGEALSYAEWKEIEFQINLYINTLKKAIEDKLK
jgi:hypothetical protein